ncbi:MAG: VOC family protein [Solirubrobacteraceae bacterium]
MSATGLQQIPAGASLPADVALGPVSLTVSDLKRAADFYERVLGLRARALEDGGLALGPPSGGGALVKLHGDLSAAPLDRRSTGLFHVAILLPSRAELAHALLRIAREHWPLDGASDHLVSEALYLSDPDGNGIELYRDRPREQWRYEGGRLQMATLPLDLRSLAAEVGSDQPVDPVVAPGTTVGHVHLQVGELVDVEAFYHGVLGFDVTVREYPGALFVSAGGYHHHLGLNTWNSAGSGPPLPGSVGLRSHELILPDRIELDRVLDRLREAGFRPQADGTGAQGVRDPSGNLLLLSCR